MSKFITQITWADAVHLSPEEQADLLNEIPPYLRDARTKGIPQLGSGAIYPVGESDFKCAQFIIPEHFPRAYALDVGFNYTAAIWGAKDPETKIVYIYSAYKRSAAEPSIHAEAVKSRGSWIPGVVDPAARGRSQKDGESLIQIYQDLGLDIQPAKNAVEAGLHLVWQMLSVGQLKVFDNLHEWFDEFRLYRRDEKGRVVKDNDHLMDATRYDMVSGMERARVKPVRKKTRQDEIYLGQNASLSWMG